MTNLTRVYASNIWLIECGWRFCRLETRPIQLGRRPGLPGLLQKIRCFIRKKHYWIPLVTDERCVAGYVRTAVSNINAKKKRKRGSIPPMMDSDYDMHHEK